VSLSAELERDVATIVLDDLGLSLAAIVVFDVNYRLNIERIHLFGEETLDLMLLHRLLLARNGRDVLNKANHGLVAHAVKFIIVGSAEVEQGRLRLVAITDRII
jgi:hypothetical protein